MERGKFLAGAESKSRLNRLVVEAGQFVGRAVLRLLDRGVSTRGWSTKIGKIISL